MGSRSAGSSLWTIGWLLDRTPARGRAIRENFERDALPKHPEYEKHRARIASAGLRVSDETWRAHVPNGERKGERGKIEPHAPSNPVNFGYLLGQAEGLDAVTLDVLRDGECVPVALPLK